MASRMQKAVRTGVLGAALATLVVTGFAVPAYADPDAVARAKEKVDALAMEAAALDQEAVGAQVKLDEARTRLANREEDVAKQTERVAAMRADVGRVALAQFQNRDLDPTTQLVLRADSDTFLSQYATMQQVTANQNGALQDFQAEQANLADMERGAAADVETIDRSTEEIKKARDASAKKLDEAEAVLARLTAEERARLQAEAEREARESAAAAERAAQQAERAQAARAAERAAQERAAANNSTPPSTAPQTASQSPRAQQASNNSTQNNSSQSTSAQNNATQAETAPAPAAGNSSSRGLAALAFARAQIGKPYVYGGTGPEGYDCSGLTGAAWRSAGVSLPRTSQQQFGAGRAVSINELVPGDLVFYYSGISHVAIYAGGGQIVHASRPGKPIGYDPLQSMPIAGARRVG